MEDDTEDGGQGWQQWEAVLSQGPAQGSFLADTSALASISYQHYREGFKGGGEGRKTTLWPDISA